MALSRTGLRSGELLALQWGELHFDKREIRIERALHDGQTPPPGDRYVLGPVKGGPSRTIAFDLTCGALLRSGDRVFMAMPGRAVWLSGLRSASLRAQRHYRTAQPDRDLPRLTVHELRHTHASLLFEAGQSVAQSGAPVRAMGQRSSRDPLRNPSSAVLRARSDPAPPLNSIQQPCVAGPGPAG